MITLPMRPMRQLHPSLPTCRLSPEHCRCVNNSGSRARLLCTSVRCHVRPAPRLRSATGVYHSCSRSILSISWSSVPSAPPPPAIRYSHLRPPPPCPPRATPVRNLATQSSSFRRLLSSFGMDHCHRHRVNPRPKRVLVASRLTGATRPGPAQSSYRISCFIIANIISRSGRPVSSKIAIKIHAKL